MAASAAAIVARFHATLLDFNYAYKSPRSGVHNLPRHVANLESALASHPEHPLWGQASALAEKLLHHAKSIDSLSALPARHCHGDLKWSNVLFDSQKQAIGLCDLDTLCLASWPIELGDAFRSWCNRTTEDTPASHFDNDFFRASVAAYAHIAKAFWSRSEVDALVMGVLNVTLELACRFCADIVNESYFGFDRASFARAGEHNILRTRSQLALFESALSQRTELEAIVLRAFSPE
jgi:Ser/Thr protein kinase RdoA (MazF antagonist)